MAPIRCNSSNLDGLIIKANYIGFIIIRKR